MRHIHTPDGHGAGRCGAAMPRQHTCATNLRCRRAGICTVCAARVSSLLLRMRISHYAAATINGNSYRAGLMQDLEDPAHKYGRGAAADILVDQTPDDEVLVPGFLCTFTVTSFDKHTDAAVQASLPDGPPPVPRVHAAVVKKVAGFGGGARNEAAFPRRAACLTCPRGTSFSAAP